MFVWGISWPSAKVVGKYADAELLMIWRFFFGAITMIPIMQLLKIKLLRMALDALILILFFLNSYVHRMKTFSLKKEQIKKNEILGIFLGVIGGTILLNIWNISFLDLSRSGNLYYIIAAIVWAGATICTQKAKSELNAVNFSMWIYIVAIILVTPITPMSSLFDIISFDWIFWLNFLVISSLSLGFGTTIFFLATMKIGSNKTSSFMYLVPVSALAFSVIFLGEELATTTILGGGLALLGVCLVNQK